MNTITQEPTSLPWGAKLVESVKKRERMGLAIGVALQLIVLVFMIIKGVLILIRGDIYFVRVQPVDPRDLMRGDYVILSYAFSQPPQYLIEGKNWRDLRQQPIYVSLKKESDDKHWQASSFSLEKPSEGPFLCGKWGPRGRLEFGIEQFYVQEGKGLEYEAANRSRKLSSEISITPEGVAAMRALHVLEE